MKAIYENEGVHVQNAADCYVCGRQGQVLYTDLQDRLFGAPGTWNFFRCPNCGLLWLNPRPIPDDLHKVYIAYYTHETRGEPLPRLPQEIKNAILAKFFGYESLVRGARWKWTVDFLSLVPTLKDMVGLSVMWLKAGDRGKIVDVGSGGGQFLAKMRDLGWEVLGIEPDTQAAKIAKDRFGIPVLAGTLEKAGLPDNSFDAVTMDHVIEHVHNPIGLLKEIKRILKPKGKLIITTPNVESLGLRLFHQNWRGLEPPRHLYLFTTSTLQQCIEQVGLSIEELGTTARKARSIWWTSRLIHRCRKNSESGGNRAWPELLEGYMFQIFEEVMRIIWKTAGEEILLVAAKTLGGDEG